MQEFHVSKRDDQRWTVRALDGVMRGQVVAIVEGVVMKEVMLDGTGSVVGVIDAVWGAEIEDAAFDDVEMVLALGLNRAFRARQATLPLQFCGRCWMGAGRVVRSSRRVVILKDRVYASLS